MPLPNSNEAWPPKALQPITAKLTEWDAWYSGDPRKLDAAYRGPAQPVTFHRSQYRGGLVGTVARWFWGTPDNTAENRTRLHIPIAADLCQASSDLLFADPPTISTGDKTSDERIGVYFKDGMTTRLSEAAEIIAALGGGYLRVSWDDTVADHPFTTKVDADAAYPEFNHGRLAAVTFWWKWTDGATVYRQLERHETQAGIGIIEHGLYRGSGNDLGVRVPLAEHPRTAPLADLVNADSQISTDSPDIAVTYVPNLMPNRLWRSDPLGAYLGRSDLDGIEPLMDSLDETYSSWMRDIRLGKGRVLVPDYMLETGKPGQGVTFDYDREVFTPLAAAPQADGRFEMQIAQFAIRVEEHQRTAQQLIKDILRSAGYSTQTFGEEEQSTQSTATEIRSRDRRTALMRDRKVRQWSPALIRHVSKLLRVDQAIYRRPIGDLEQHPVTVQFNDAPNETQLELAQTANTLAQAAAASRHTLVRLVHPDWNDTQVLDEVAAINAEQGLGPLADPATLGATGNGI